jgi:selenocysteine-specific elongation factor
MVGVYDDHYVIRAFSPLRTIAGGKLLSPMGIKVRRRSQDLESLDFLRSKDSRLVLRTQLHRAGKSGLTRAELHVLTALPAKELEKDLQYLASKQEIFLFDREEQRYVSGAVVEALQSGLLIDRCLKQKKMVTDKEVLRLPEHSISLASDQSKLKEDLLQTYQQAGIEPPNLNSVLETLQVSKKEALAVMALLMEEGKLVKINDSLYFSTQAINDIRDRVARHFVEHDSLTPTDFKNITGLSRKFSIPLLEYLDKQKITMRVGDVRKLRKGQ